LRNSPDGIRIIPTILVDGVNVVKGREFINERVVGNAYATAKVYGKRFIDELMILDVKARSQDRLADIDLVKAFANELSVPFSIGGGINSLQDALKVIDQGAEKVVVGTSILEHLDELENMASTLGAQAIVVSIVFDGELGQFFNPSTRISKKVDVVDALRRLSTSGAGEFLIQSRSHEGQMSGVNHQALQLVSTAITNPVIIGSGVGSTEHVVDAIKSGAGAVSIGSLFQFTEMTPESLAVQLHDLGIPVRLPRQ